MSSLVRTLEKRILKSIGIKRDPSFIHPTTGKTVRGNIFSSDHDIDYGNTYPQLVRLPTLSKTPQFTAMPKTMNNLA